MILALLMTSRERRTGGVVLGMTPVRHRSSSHLNDATTRDAPPWFACYTQPRREKKVQRWPRDREVECFLPLVPRVSHWHERRKTIEWPLFRSYLFVKCPPGELGSITGTRGVAAVVRFGAEPAVIPEHEIDNIARFADKLRETGWEPPAAQFEPGQRVKITAGPFEGVVGIVVEARSRRRVIVGLQTIGLGFEVDVPRDSLKSIE